MVHSPGNVPRRHARIQNNVRKPIFPEVHSCAVLFVKLVGTAPRCEFAAQVYLHASARSLRQLVQRLFCDGAQNLNWRNATLFDASPALEQRV